MYMPKYKNLSKRSGVVSYSSSRGKLNVKFKDGSKYLYTPSSCGKYKMNRMRQLASKGIGLNGYINKSVRIKYQSKS